MTCTSIFLVPETFGRNGKYTREASLTSGHYQGDIPAVRAPQEVFQGWMASQGIRASSPLSGNETQLAQLQVHPM